MAVIRFSLLPVLVTSLAVGTATLAAEPRPVAERPWVTGWVSSIARLLTACDIVYDSVNRPDLADTLEDRLDFRDFQGIDRTRPFGFFWTWDDEKDAPATIFLPAKEMPELMQTATFGVVGFHKVRDDQYEIERPGVPYHVLVRNGYALFGEEVAALHALREAPDRITRELRDKYDVALVIDQRQVPRAARTAWVESLRAQVEPWLQPQDDEPQESAFLRRALGKGLLDACEQVLQDVETVTIGGRIDRRTYQLRLEVVVQAEPGSTMAAELNRLVVHRSEFSALVNRDASAGLAINWPLMLLGKDLIALNKDLAVAGRLDMGVQLVGGDWNDMTLIAGMRGPEASALNAALPQVLRRLEKSGKLSAVEQGPETYRNVAIRSVRPTALPDLLQSVAPGAAEFWIGQEKNTVWFAAGVPDSTRERLKAAIDAIAETPPEDRARSVVQARLAVGQWPTVLPLLNPQDTQTELGNSRDGFRLSVEPALNGFKIQLVAEEGLLRVIGRHWTREVDHAATIPKSN